MTFAQRTENLLQVVGASNVTTSGRHAPATVTPANAWLSCWRKRKYPTRARAINTALRFHQHVYQCTLCGDFHLTSKK